eukprot:6195853-Pleurochrysis_carterae.AAC.2
MPEATCAQRCDNRRVDERGANDSRTRAWRTSQRRIPIFRAQDAACVRGRFSRLICPTDSTSHAEFQRRQFYARATSLETDSLQAYKSKAVESDATRNQASF